MSVATTNLAYFWGEDAYGIERAVRRMAVGSETIDGTGRRAGRGADASRDLARRCRSRRRRWAPARPRASSIASPSAWARRRSSAAARSSCSASRCRCCARRRVRERLVALVGDVPPGNALAITELVDGGRDRRSRPRRLRDAVSEARRRRARVPGADPRAHGALDRRARDGARPDARPGRRPTARRAGRRVRPRGRRRSPPPDRAGQRRAREAGALRPDGAVTATTSPESVPEAIPGSTWAFLDAVGLRHAARGRTDRRAAARRWDAAAGARGAAPSAAAGAGRRARAHRRRHASRGPGARAEAAAVPGAEAGRAGRDVGARRARWRPRRAAGARPARARASASTASRARCRMRARRSGSRSGWQDRWRAHSVARAQRPVRRRAPGARHSAEDQASSWRTRSDSMAKTQRLVGEVEQLDQLGIDVQLVAVLAQAAGDAEAEPLGAVIEAEGRVEARVDELARALRAAFPEPRHRFRSTSPFVGPGTAGHRGRRVCEALP